MPTNKSALVRYRVLDRCFRNPAKRYFIDDLIEACSEALYKLSDKSIGVSRRQIFDDMAFMESAQGYNATILKLRDSRKVYYRYEDTSFSINNQPFSEMEEIQIKEALETLSRFKGLPQFEWVNELIARIDSGFNLSKSEHSIIQFDQNKYLKGLDFITPIYNAIIYKQVISVDYKSFKVQEIQKFVLHPYFLKQYNNRWFLFAQNDASDRIINIALDRIESLRELKKKYKENTKYNFNEYFEDIVGVSINENSSMQTILLSVNNNLLPYIETKPIHGSQKMKGQGPSSALISLDVIPNYELESLILSYGEGIEVVQPKSLRDKINGRLSLMKINYKKSADRLHKRI